MMPTTVPMVELEFDKSNGIAAIPIRVKGQIKPFTSMGISNDDRYPQDPSSIILYPKTNTHMGNLVSDHQLRREYARILKSVLQDNPRSVRDNMGYYTHTPLEFLELYEAFVAICGDFIAPTEESSLIYKAILRYAKRYEAAEGHPINWDERGAKTKELIHMPALSEYLNGLGVYTDGFGIHFHMLRFVRKGFFGGPKAAKTPIQSPGPIVDAVIKNKRDQKSGLERINIDLTRIGLSKTDKLFPLLYTEMAKHITQSKTYRKSTVKMTEIDMELGGLKSWLEHLRWWAEGVRLLMEHADDIYLSMLVNTLVRLDKSENKSVKEDLSAYYGVNHSWQASTIYGALKKIKVGPADSKLALMLFQKDLGILIDALSIHSVKRGSPISGVLDTDKILNPLTNKYISRNGRVAQDLALRGLVVL